MKEKKNIIIVVLVLLLGVSLIYIGYDKIMSDKDNNVVNNNNKESIENIFTSSMFDFENSISFAELNLKLLEEKSDINNSDFITYLNSYLSYIPLVTDLNNENNIERITAVIDNIAIKSGIMIDTNSENQWLIPISFMNKVLFKYFNLKTYNYNQLNEQYYELVNYNDLQYLKVKKDMFNSFNSGQNLIINETVYENGQIIAKGIVYSYQIGYGTDSNYYNKSDDYSILVYLNNLGNIINIEYERK